VARLTWAVAAAIVASARVQEDAWVGTAAHWRSLRSRHCLGVACKAAVVRNAQPSRTRRSLLLSLLGASTCVGHACKARAQNLPTPQRPPQAAAAVEQQPLEAALSGAVQGVAQNVAKQLVLHPFDTVKTRLQVPDAVSSGSLFNDLYRGLLPTLVGGTPGSATFFAAKEAATSLLLSRGALAPIPTLGGVVSGVLAAKAVRTPFDVAETRAMATISTKKEASNLATGWDGSWEAVQDVYRKEGVRGLYRGYGANVAYKLPADAAKFLAYEGLRAGGADTIWSPAVAGAAATLAASAVTTPLDVVRTQVLTGTSTSGPLETFRSLAAKDPGKLWAGLGWRLARGVVAGSIQFSVLESTKNAVQSVTK